MFFHILSHSHSPSPARLLSLSPPSLSIQKSPLHQAAVSNDIQAMTSLLTSGSGIDVNSVDEDGNTPLHIIAPKLECLRMAKLLLDNGADPNLKNQAGQAPLHIAIMGLFKHDKADMVKILLESKGTDVNLIDGSGNTPLLYALYYFYDQCLPSAEDTIRKLLKKGADANVQDEYGVTPLCRAVILGDKIMVKRLIEYGANVNIEYKGHTLLYIAATGCLRYTLPEGWWWRFAVGDHVPYADAATAEEDRPLYSMVKFFLMKRGDSIDWQDEGYRKKLLKDTQDEKIKVLLAAFLKPIIQKGTMNEQWIMETSKFISYLQWVPREVMDDIHYYFFQTPDIFKRKRIAEEEDSVAKKYRA